MADDILQEALMDIYKRWDKVKDHPNLEAYTVRVMVSRHADARRKIRRTKQDQELSLESAAELASLSGEQENVAETLMVQNALKSLSAPQRAVLMLHYEFGFALREIGELLGIPAGTVASHLARGKSSVAAYVNFLPEIMNEDKNKQSSNNPKSLEYFAKEVDE